jgi:purine-binding chemotaxis protein CheW
MAEPRRPPAAVPERQLVLFSVGSVVYGLPIDRVREVVNPLPVVELPHAPRAVIGVTDHRGEVVPVLDLRTRFHLAAVDDAEGLRRIKWIILDVTEGRVAELQRAGGGVTPLSAAEGASGRATRLIAVVVDVVHNVFMTREALRPPPPLGGGEDDRGILGVLSRGSSAEAGLVFVLDMERLRGLVEPLKPELPPKGPAS